jgi:hypothetical protein
VTREFGDAKLLGVVIPMCLSQSTLCGKVRGTSAPLRGTPRVPDNPTTPPAEQDFELGPACFPQSVACERCHRGLTLAETEEQ